MRTVPIRRRPPPRAPHPARDWILGGLVTATLLAGGAWAASGPRSADTSAATSRELPHGLAVLRHVQRRLPEPGPMDWLANHREAGESFDAWRARRPVTATGTRRVLYIQPIGEFLAVERLIVILTADYMARYFALEVHVLEDIELTSVPAGARRRDPEWGSLQILSTWVLDSVLKPNLPADAAAVIGFTTSDLWPGEGWNFVFGQASLRDRVGVWSIARNGDPGGGDEAFRLCLRRTCQTATHETGHMFSMRHCIAYHCNMNGSNNRVEADAQPMACCPECVAKVCVATGADPIARYRALLDFCVEEGLAEDGRMIRRRLDLLEAARGP